jgi:L-gulonate 5-dehydrogenase
MKALCVHSANNLVIEDRPMPSISSSDEVLIKVKAAGICGSDVHVYHGTSPVATYPRVIGHEVAGEIIEKGSNVVEFNLGDRVVIDPVIHCGNCYQCRIGRRNVCQNLKVRSVHVDGGYQEYYVMPKHGIYKIPDQLSWDEAVMIEPFTIAEQACSRAEITADDVVFVMGAGPAGLCILKRAKMTGALCYSSDILKSRLEIARQYGADEVIDPKYQDVYAEIMRLTDGAGVTVVIDAVCNVKSFEQALTYVRPAGRVITFGFIPQPSAISQLSITAREIDVRGSRLHNNKFPAVIEHFRAGRIEVKDMITHHFHFLDIHKALKLIDDPSIEKGKVVLTF